jgi:hypothetical protein
VPRQSDDELRAISAEHGPIRASTLWLTSIFRDGDPHAMWSRMDPDLRAFFARDWLWANRDHPALTSLTDAARRRMATALSADPPPDHPIARELIRLTMEMFRDEWWPFFDLGNWGAGSKLRPVAPDYEGAAWFDRREVGQLVKETYQALGIFLLMHHVGDRWLVAGFGERPPEPTWPDGAF